jgi:hypothetical protein
MAKNEIISDDVPEETALSTELAPYALAVRESLNAAELLKDALAPGESIEFGDLTRVKAPAGGSVNWELPNGEAAKEITGVIVLRQPVRAFWDASFQSTGGGTPPDCASVDLQIGNGRRYIEGDPLDPQDPDGIDFAESSFDCQTCPWSKFGTAVNDDGSAAAGQRCRQITRLFVLGESLLPTLVLAPPSSAKASKGYALHCAMDLKTAMHQVETAISLEKVRSAGGIDYSELRFRAVRPLEDDERAAVDEYRRQFTPVMTGMAIESDFVDGDAS